MNSSIRDLHLEIMESWWTVFVRSADQLDTGWCKYLLCMSSRHRCELGRNLCYQGRGTDKKCACLTFACRRNWPIEEYKIISDNFSSQLRKKGKRKSSVASIKVTKQIEERYRGREVLPCNRWRDNHGLKELIFIALHLKKWKACEQNCLWDR